MDDAKRSENVNTRIPRPTRGRVPPYLISAPVARQAGSKRRLQEPECPINAKDSKLAENINDWLSVVRKNVDREQNREMPNTEPEGSHVYPDRVSCREHVHRNDNFRRRVKNRNLKTTATRRRQQSNVYQHIERSPTTTTNSPVIGSYSQPSPSYYDQCKDETYPDYSFNEQGPDSLFVFSAGYQRPNSACDEPQGSLSNNIKLKDERDSPEPVDLVASETYMYVLSDDEESSPKKRKKRSKRRRKQNCSKINKEGECIHLSEEEKDDEPNSQPETDSEITEPHDPVATETNTSVLSDNKKPRKRRRKRSKKKRKAQCSHVNQEVTSQDNELARSATVERFRLAQINVLRFQLNELTLKNCKPEIPYEVKRKHGSVCREDDFNSFGVNNRKVFIGDLTLESYKQDQTYGIKHKQESVCREGVSTCDVDSLDVEINKLNMDELTLESCQPGRPVCREETYYCKVDSIDEMIRKLNIG